MQSWNTHASHLKYALSIEHCAVLVDMYIRAADGMLLHRVCQHTSVDHCPSATQCATPRPPMSSSARLLPLLINLENRSAFPCVRRSVQLGAAVRQ